MANGNIEIKDINIEDAINGISAPRFRNGGAPMLVAIIRNHIVDIAGANIKIPLLIINARELDISQAVLVIKNRAEDDRPWAIIIITEAFHPQAELERIPAIPRPMWATDEQAISDFMSCCREQISLVMAAPPSDTARIEGLMELIRFGIVMAKRIIPNVPSLRRIPARIIDPATGASTWALGSHK